jgi:hypothetical protein
LELVFFVLFSFLSYSGFVHHDGDRSAKKKMRITEISNFLPPPMGLFVFGAVAVALLLLYYYYLRKSPWPGVPQAFFWLPGIGSFYVELSGKQKDFILGKIVCDNPERFKKGLLIDNSPILGKRFLFFFFLFSFF